MSVDLTIGPYATPDDVHSTRKIIPYSSNKTASYVSNIFLGSGFHSSERNRDGTVRLEKNYCGLRVEDILANEYTVNPDLCWVANQIKQDIQNHIEIRLQLFLMQIMLLFQSKIKVHQFHTQAQAGDKNKTSYTNTLKPTEVHAGTLPNLIANTEEEVDLSYYTDQTELKPRVFAKDTSFYEQANITHKLPCFVNDVDSNIDFRKTELENLCDTFREQSVNILNRVSTDAKMTPQNAFHNFMKRLYEKVKKIQPESIPEHKWVLYYYSEVIGSYLKQNEDPNFIKKLMFDQNLDFPLIAHALRQKFQYELLLLKKISEIQIACEDILKGTQNYEEAIRCLLAIGTDSGRITLLKERTSHLKDTQEKYCRDALKISTIAETANRIICNDLALAWVDFHPHQIELLDLIDFEDLIKKELIKKTGKKTIKNINVIALRILWIIAKKLQIGNVKMATFLCCSSEEALTYMKNHNKLSRNVESCLKKDGVKKLLGEFTQLLRDQ